MLRYCEGDTNAVINELRENMYALCDVLVVSRFLQATEMTEEVESLIQNPDVLCVEKEGFCDVWRMSLGSVSEQVADFCKRGYEHWARVNSLARFYGDNKPTSMQVAFCIDTTGSMGACLGQMRLRVKDALTQLIDICGDRIQFAAMAHGDYCDGVPIRVSPFTTNIEQIAMFVNSLSPAGGGPTPEAYEWAMNEAQSIGWNTSPQCAKALVLVGDSYPHCPSYTTHGLYWRDECETLRGMGVVVSTVVAAGSSVAAIVFMRELARIGGGVVADLSFQNEHERGWHTLLRHLKTGARLVASGSTDSTMRALDSACLELFKETPKKVPVQNARAKIFQDKDEPGDGLEWLEEEERWYRDTRDEQWWDRERDRGQPVFQRSLEDRLWDRIR